jgi:hypothetical protein
VPIDRKVRQQARGGNTGGELLPQALHRPRAAIELHGSTLKRAVLQLEVFTLGHQEASDCTALTFGQICMRSALRRHDGMAETSERLVVRT